MKWPTASIPAMLTNTALAPSHLPHLLTCWSLAPGSFCSVLPPTQPCSANISPTSPRPWLSIALFLAVLATLARLKHHHLIRVAMAQQMQQCKESLHQEIRLLRNAEQSRPVEETTLLSVWQQWLFWTRKMKLASNSCCDQNSSSSRKKENNNENKNSSEEHSGIRSLVVPILLPIQVLPVPGSTKEPGV